MAEAFDIQEMAPLGDGVSLSPRGRVYVERTLPGDRVQARVQKSGGLLRGVVTTLIESSPHRVPPPCPHYESCGGCSLQHAAPGFYQDWKAGVVRMALARQGITPETWRDPVFLPGATRRRATFAAFKKKNRVSLGYFRRRTHQVAEIGACLVADPAVMELRAQLVTALVPMLQDDKAADIFIQAADSGREIVITGPVGRKGFPDLQVHEAVAEIAHTLKVNRIAWRRREQDSPEVMLEVAPVFATFGGFDVALPPLAFLQPTKPGELALTAAVVDALPATGTFADLFSGSGTFAGSMLARGAVDAFENAEAAVRALDKAKGPRPLKAQRRDLFANPLDADELGRYDAVVFDPPRIGAEDQARALAASGVPTVVGVSCNPITFARDARILADGGYTLESVQVVDQFLWSHHVELVGVFSRHS